MAFHVAAIVQAGQRVRDRHLDRVLHVVAQMIGVAALADLGAGARQQLVLVDRPQQIVVDADLEPAQQPRIVVGVGDREDRHLPRALQRARLAAQPQAVEIFEAERDDQQVVIAFGGVEQRLRRIGLDVDGVLGAQHRRQPLVGRRPVVDQQDAAALAGVGDRAALRRLHADLERGDGAHAQLVGHHLQPRQRAHARDQHDVGHRLGQEIVGAGVEPAHAVGGAVERGDHHDGNEMGRRIGLQPAADLETVHVGHHDVEQDDVAFGARADLERLGAVGGGQHVEIFGRQPGFQQLDVGGNVVDDQDTRGHRNSLLPDKSTHGLDELADRNRLGQIGLAAAFADALLVALHRKRGDRDDGNGAQFRIVLDPARDLEAGDLRQLDIHQDQIGAQLADEIERLETVAGAGGLIAMRFQQIAKELHVELVVLHDQDGLWPSRPSLIPRARYGRAQAPAVRCIGAASDFIQK